MELVWLALAVAAGLGAFLAGRGALRSRRERHGEDANEARYRAWRGRAARPSRPQSAGMTPRERRSTFLAAALALASAACLAAFLAAGR